jgi:hypothetical protein
MPLAILAAGQQQIDPAMTAVMAGGSVVDASLVTRAVIFIAKVIDSTRTQVQGRHERRAFRPIDRKFALRANRCA